MTEERLEQLVEGAAGRFDPVSYTHLFVGAVSWLLSSVL